MMLRLGNGPRKAGSHRAGFAFHRLAKKVPHEWRSLAMTSSSILTLLPLCDPQRLVRPLLLAALLGSVTATSSAQTWEPGSIGVFFDQAGTQTTTSVPSGGQFEAYVIAHDPGDFQQFEFTIDLGSDPNVFVVSRQFPNPSWTDSAPGDDDFLVSLPCEAGVGPVLLVTYTLFAATTFQDYTMEVTALGGFLPPPSSFDPPSPGFESCASTLRRASASYCGPAVVNPFALWEPQWKISDLVLDFGVIEPGTTADDSFTVTNIGAFPELITVSYGCPEYSILSGAGGYLEPDETLVVTLRFQPPAPGQYLCDVTFDIAPCTVVLSGEGDAPPACDVFPSALDFGEVSLGSPDTSSFTITNVGGGTLTGDVTESCPDVTLIAGGGPFGLSGGQSRTVEVRYDALIPGPLSCSIDTGVDCPTVPITGNAFGIQSITDVGNDQGRHVRTRWVATVLDAPGSPTPILEYSLWRRVEPGLKTSAEADQPRSVPMAFPPGEWDYVLSVPARGEASYSTVAPTLCDSTASGICWSTFFLSAQTADPLVFVDTPPDSGYSVDNLAPGVPQSLGVDYDPAGNDVAWQQSTDADFRFFRIYRSMNPVFVPGPGNLVNEVVSPAWTDPTGDTSSSYKVAAVDLSGNEGPAAAPSVMRAFTPAGTDVHVSLGGIQLAFDEVAASGTTTVAVSSNGPSFPSGLEIIPDLAVFFDVSTTATYSGSVEVCIGYGGASLPGSESGVTLLHYAGSPPSWVEITTTRDTEQHLVCGTATYLSILAVAWSPLPSEVESAPRRTPFALKANFPNPFNPVTHIPYRIDEPSGVTLRIYDVAGQLVRNLLSGGHKEVGWHTVAWDGRDNAGRPASSGVYYYRMDVGRWSETRRMVLVK